ncbi:MAG: hypothetical protein PVI97_20510 [Candidatus Thiodiazotropha sp.]|jgi:hypothetical protein
MKIRSVAAVVVATFISANAVAEMDEAQMTDIESSCQQYAQEDGITQDEMEAYLAQCVQDFVMSQSAGESEYTEGELNE